MEQQSALSQSERVVPIFKRMAIEVIGLLVKARWYWIKQGKKSDETKSENDFNAAARKVIELTRKISRMRRLCRVPQGETVAQESTDHEQFGGLMKQGEVGTAIERYVRANLRLQKFYEKSQQEYEFTLVLVAMLSFSLAICTALAAQNPNPTNNYIFAAYMAAGAFFAAIRFYFLRTKSKTLADK